MLVTINSTPRLPDPRVTNLQGQNARDLQASQLNQPPQILVSDVSFISLTLAMPPAMAIAPLAPICLR